jgi:pre-mRNA-splicing factor ATP-dependent RNA helicase DHX38/PRP16
MWDAPTPRAVRGGSPEDGDGALGIDAREWEEEQVRLDRDWYTGAEKVGLLVTRSIIRLRSMRI